MVEVGYSEENVFLVFRIDNGSIPIVRAYSSGEVMFDTINDEGDIAEAIDFWYNKRFKFKKELESISECFHNVPLDNVVTEIREKVQDKIDTIVEQINL